MVCGPKNLVHSVPKLICEFLFLCCVFFCGGAARFYPGMRLKASNHGAKAFAMICAGAPSSLGFEVGG